MDLLDDIQEKEYIEEIQPVEEIAPIEDQYTHYEFMSNKFNRKPISYEDHIAEQARLFTIKLKNKK